VLYLIDYGKTTPYRDLNTGLHHKTCPKSPILQNSDFQSKNQIIGATYSRRDDLESIGNILIYLISGTLPWFNQPKNSKLGKRAERKPDIMTDSRQYVTLGELCKGMPQIICKYMYYCQHALEFD